MAAGPTKARLPQKMGQLDVHAAHRMHFVVSSYRARSSGVCSRSRSGGGSRLTKYGITDRYCAKNGSKSTTRSLTTRNATSGATVIWPPRLRTSVWQARRLRPLMSMASLPRMPWPQELRKTRVPSYRSRTLRRRSSTRSKGPASSS